MRRLSRVILALAGAAVASLVVGLGPAGAGQGMIWNQWEIDGYTFDQCMSRARPALKAAGQTTIEEHGRFWFGSSTENASVSLSCYGTAKGVVITLVISWEPDRKIGDRIYFAMYPVLFPPVPPPQPGAPPTDQSTFVEVDL